MLVLLDCALCSWLVPSNSGLGGGGRRYANIGNFLNTVLSFEFLGNTL